MATSVELVAENFCIKYDPPTFGILYHLTSNKEAKFMHNVELQITPAADPREIANRLFETESLYLDRKVIQPAQVEKLIRKIVMRKARAEEAKIEPVPQDQEKMSGARERLLKRKGLMGVVEQKPDTPEEEEENSKKQEPEFLIDDFGDLDDGLPFEKEGQTDEAKQLQKSEEKVVAAAAVETGEKVEGAVGGEEVDVSGENEEFITIHDIQYRKIQIEGDEEEYLMDPEGNIFNMQGQFIGTANGDPLEGEEEDLEGAPDDLPFD